MDSKTPACPERDITITKRRHQVLALQVQAIGAIYLQIKQIDKDLANSLSLLKEFVNITKARMSSEPLYGQEIEAKAFNWLLRQTCAEKISKLFKLYLAHQAKGETTTLGHFSLSDWDSHQLFACLGANHQVVVIERLSNVLLAEILGKLPIGWVLAMPNPKEYSPLDWEKILLDYLKGKGILKDGVPLPEDGVCLYHLELDFSKNRFTSADIKNLCRILEPHLPLRSLTLRHMGKQQNIMAALDPLSSSSEAVSIFDQNQ